jgi:rhodanese-related sulfurtransferase/glyoxylase-like metal-dependent hydrolase (beta-lactamase superfamily II)
VDAGDDKMITAVIDDGLGNSAYLVDLGDGRALAVDPSLDLRAFRTEVERQKLTVAFAADTHLHADFLSGALQLAEADGTQVLASAAGGRMFDHAGLSDGDEVDLGGLTLRALATPGHTGEHLAFELLDGGTRLGVFTGGSLIVGGAARTDLAGNDRTEALSRAQYRSLRRLADLPDTTAVWPTHGAGSFCSAPGGGDRTTTIGREKAANPLLTAPDEDTFVKQLLGGLGSFPPYFLRLPEENRRGSAVAGEPAVPGLDAARIAKLSRLGAVVIDVRPVRDFAAGHIPGALSIPLRAQFVSWLGWLLPPSTPYVVVRRPDQDLSEIVWQALKIGYDVPVGELSGGMSSWEGPTTRTPLLTASELGTGRVLDVRQDNEFHSGHVPDALHVELGDLPDRVADVPTGPVVVMCGHGERAMTAASVLLRAGHTGVRVLEGGADDWAAATGRSLA